MSSGSQYGGFAIKGKVVGSAVCRILGGLGACRPINPMSDAPAGFKGPMSHGALVTSCVVLFACGSFSTASFNVHAPAVARTPDRARFKVPS